MVFVHSLWFILVAALLGYAFVFGFLWRVNEWYYVSRLGRKIQHTLPPGHLGWPFLGNMLTFFRAFKSDPDSFINDLVSRYLFSSLTSIVRTLYIKKEFTIDLQTVYRYGRTGIYRTFLFWSPSIIVCTPEICRKVLSDDEQLKLGYPALSLFGKRSFHGISNEEHKRLRRLTTPPITGQALSTYIGLTEDASVKVLEELSSMTTPSELLTELRKFAFKIITTIFMGSDVHHVDLGLFQNLYRDLSRGAKSLPIHLPGFAFYKAHKVN